MIPHSMNIDDNVRGQRLNQRACEKGNHRAEDTGDRRAAKRKLCHAGRSGFLAAKAQRAQRSAEQTRSNPLRPSAPLRFHLFLWSALGILCFAAHGFAQESAWRVILEPKFMHREISWPVPGADRTVIAPVVVKGDDYLFPSKKVWDGFHLDDAEIQRRGAVAAAEDLATLKPRYERDRNQVIQYAELKSDRPIVASAVLAPKFRDLFRDTLGDEIYLVVPNRFTAYVFPVLASNYQDYYPLVLDAYNNSTWPVSVEVFELGPKGMRTVGLYREP